MSEIKYVLHYGVPFQERKKIFDTKAQAEKFIKDHVFIGRTILNKDGSVNRLESDTIYLEKVEKLDADFTVVASKDPAVVKCRNNDSCAIDRKAYEKAKSETTEKAVRSKAVRFDDVIGPHDDKEDIAGMVDALLDGCTIKEALR